MSEWSPPSPPPSPPAQPKPPLSPPTTPAAVAGRDIVRDVYQWRRKKQSILVLLGSTVTWVVLKVYNFNFIPLASYVAIAVSASFFASASVLRLMGKYTNLSIRRLLWTDFKRETRKLSDLEITEETAVKMGKTVKELCEDGLKWMLRVGAQGEFFDFAKIVAVLWIISYIARFTDLLTFVYAGIVVGVIVPPVYTKYEHNIKKVGNRTRMQCVGVYNMMNDRVMSKMKNVADGERKDKKGKKVE